MKKYFITGLVILLPALLTIFLVVFVVNFLTRPFMGMVSQLISVIPLGKLHITFLTHQQMIRYGSQITILISLFLAIIGLGFLARNFFFNALINISDKILAKIPFINKVYKTSQEIIKTLFITDKNSFKQVVLVPFPTKSSYCLGLLSRDAPITTKKHMLSVFIPTTPNPTTGFLLMFEKKDVFFLDMKTEEAIKYIVSCGVVIPKQRAAILKNPIYPNQSNARKT